MTKKNIKFVKTWQDENDQEIIVGKPFTIWVDKEESSVKQHVRFTFDEVTELLFLQNTKGKILMCLEEPEELEMFFKRVKEFKKALKEHPLGFLD